MKSARSLHRTRSGVDSFGQIQNIFVSTSLLTPQWLFVFSARLSRVTSLYSRVNCANVSNKRLTKRGSRFLSHSVSFTRRKMLKIGEFVSASVACFSPYCSYGSHTHSLQQAQLHSILNVLLWLYRTSFGVRAALGAFNNFERKHTFFIRDCKSCSARVSAAAKLIGNF